MLIFKEKCTIIPQDISIAIILIMKNIETEVKFYNRFYRIVIDLGIRIERRGYDFTIRVLSISYFISL